MTDTVQQQILFDVDLALQGLAELFPVGVAIGEGFSPAVAALQPFVPAIEATIKGVDTVVKAGETPAAAVQIVADHNTPGASNTPLLGPDATTGQSAPSVAT